MSGDSTWGSTGSICGSGRPAPGLVEDDLKLPGLAGLAVLSRKPEAAPSDAAVMFPGAEQGQARRFETANGSGWFFADEASREACVAIDDAGTGYGVVCATYANAVANGVEALMLTAKLDGSGILVRVVPDGVNSAVIRGRDGAERRVAAEQGVVVADLIAGDQVVDAK